MSEYNGHPSYDHWNVSLWLFNDEPIYRAMRQIVNVTLSLSDATRLVAGAMRDTFGDETPDGVEITEDLVEYAIEDEHAEAWDTDDES